MNGGFVPTGGNFDPHSPGPIGDVTPGTVSATAMSATGDISSGGKLQITGAATADSTGKFGSIEIQPFSLNNSWFGENVYYDGANFRLRQTGAGGLFYFNGDEGQLRFCASGASGSMAALTCQFKVVSSGGIYLGGSIDTSPGGTTGAFLSLDGNGGTVRNGTNGQTLSVYATYTDDSNFSRLLIQNTTSTLEFIIDEAGSGVNTVTGFSFNKPIGMVSSGGPEQSTGVPTPVNYYGDQTVMMGAPTGFVDITVSGVLKSVPYYG